MKTNPARACPECVRAAAFTGSLAGSVPRAHAGAANSKTQTQNNRLIFWRVSTTNFAGARHASYQ